MADEANCLVSTCSAVVVRNLVRVSLRMCVGGNNLVLTITYCRLREKVSSAVHELRESIRCRFGCRFGLDPGPESDRNQCTDGLASQCRRVNKYETINNTRTQKLVLGRWSSTLRCYDKFPFGGSLTVHRFGIILSSLR